MIFINIFQQSAVNCTSECRERTTTSYTYTAATWYWGFPIPTILWSSGNVMKINLYGSLICNYLLIFVISKVPLTCLNRIPLKFEYNCLMFEQSYGMTFPSGHDNYILYRIKYVCDIIQWTKMKTNFQYMHLCMVQYVKLYNIMTGRSYWSTVSSG